jgi:protein associated with RNAse G/E
MSFTIIKRDEQGQEALRYTGELVARGEGWVCIRASFGFESRDLGYIHLKKGDWFTEWFYADRWYNVFRIEDAETGVLKGWYCNLTRPAEIHEEFSAADDLALDVFVHTNGAIRLLDEDEYAELTLTPEEHQAVQAALNEIRRLVAEREGPFTDIQS